MPSTHPQPKSCRQYLIELYHLPEDTSDEKLLGILCEESLTRQFQRELEQCTETPHVSPEHYKKLSKLLGIELSPPTNRT